MACLFLFLQQETAGQPLEKLLLHMPNSTCTNSETGGILQTTGKIPTVQTIVQGLRHGLQSQNSMGLISGCTT